MAFPADYTLHHGFWYLTADGSGPYFVNSGGTAYPLAQPVEDITEANLALVAASAANLGKEYWVTNRRGGCRVKSNGVSWIEQAPALNDAGASEVWASRTNGSANGELRYFTSVATVGGVSTRKIPFEWDSVNSIWRPAGGRQLLYRMAAKVSGSSATTSTATGPQVTVKGGAMGLFGELEVEIAGGTTDGTAPLTLKPQISFGGTALFETTTGQGTKKNWNALRQIKNDNNASSQIIIQGSGDIGGPGASSNGFQVDTKNTASDQTIDVSCVATYSVAKIQQLHKYNIWLVG